MEKCLLIPFLHSTSEVIAASKWPRRSNLTSNLTCTQISMSFWPSNASTNKSLAEQHKCFYPNSRIGWKSIIHSPRVFDRGKKGSPKVKIEFPNRLPQEILLRILLADYITRSIWQICYFATDIKRHSGNFQFPRDDIPQSVFFSIRTL